MARHVRYTFRGFYFSHNIDKPTEKLNTRHCHETYEILYVAEGRGRYIVEGAEFALKPRTLLLIRPFEYHCVELEADCDYERCVINFSELAVVREVKEILDRLADAAEGNSGMFFPPESISPMLLSVFDRFEDAGQLAEEEREPYFRLLLSELIVLLSLAGNEKIIHDECELGARVARYINEYLEKNISLDVIAKRFFVSKYYLCRAFKKYSGVSIHAYVTQKRIAYAKQLIDSGETASGAAYKVGFGDYSAFYRAYVKVIGKPPTSK